MSGPNRLRLFKGLLSGKTEKAQSLCQRSLPVWSRSCHSDSIGDNGITDTSSALKKRPLASSFRQPSAGISQAVIQPSPVESKRSMVPLTEPLPGMPLPLYAKPELGTGTRVTTLPNGLRIASEPKFGQFCTVGVAIDSGSRYEVALPSGVTHFVDKIAFGQTPKYPQGRNSIHEELEKFGGICDCQGSRDTMIYGISVETIGLEKAVDILGEVVLRPLVNDEAMEQMRTVIDFELEDLNNNPNPEGLLQEMIHAAAFRGNTLGLPRICPRENIPLITGDMLYRYMAQLYDPKRMVLAGVGVDHERLVQAAMGPWYNTLPIWKQQPELLGNEPLKPIDNSIAQYTGGEVTVEKDLSNVALGPNAMPELAHVVIGLESPEHQEESEFIATCVLNMIMGGGSSFSAGGPGKGMYTRLYMNVLNRQHWIQHAAALNHSYADSGVFCIHGSCHPSHLRELVEIMCNEMVGMAGTVNTVEFNRAKKQLQSMLLMNLESRPVVFEDVARQVLSSGSRKDPTFYIEAIERVKPEDVVAVAKRMLKTKPSVAALGKLEKLPLYTDICDALAGNGKLPRRFTKPWARR